MTNGEGNRRLLAVSSAVTTRQASGHLSCKYQKHIRLMCKSGPGNKSRNSILVSSYKSRGPRLRTSNVLREAQKNEKAQRNGRGPGASCTVAWGVGGGAGLLINSEAEGKEGWLLRHADRGGGQARTVVDDGDLLEGPGGAVGVADNGHGVLP